ncbi:MULTISPECIES: multidrug efflux RND transporter permease subunit AdeJ [Acinetobacter]|jgi:multidrug efflux pump|uniref:Efflux pump membrane transporter n=2 Tax=Acinetobacter TaxID=469 RepID=A0AAW5RG63_ACIJU|nr:MULTISPECIES: multidrug efflux RND transporter permease subunit AdeJ [Acinetobacter]MBY3624096.1 multidrug efflux RND transporter permease subunit AdeJ [Acinetobacter sp. CUI P1]APU49493.1 multidrug efflux RND transporter permease [Acinetobacter junii]MCE6003825.1 multidrug efflux RND transporter permease subunit AdeJ [Acinetobacter junii]MCU4398076.1 multidrug efflux RND transporter permease subunit AdeJ [Acinetobacter junii]MCU4407629.1 multidrug efflux RND transporter permease subunit Ad
MAQFFIHRPIFAWVIALVIMLAGILTLTKMPVAQYPTIAPPTVTISATYPGASAQTVENTVTQIIEQQMNGLDGLRYISSNSAGNGQASINLNFEQGIDPDIAQVQVQNKLQSATALLPADVQRQGVKVTKSGASFLQVIAFYSPDNSLSASDIKDYVNSNISEPLSRVAGVGELQVFGGSYAMRIWLDPAKLTSFNLTPSDVAAAIRSQNAQVAVGQLGGAPAVQGQVLNATVNAQSMLQTPEQFKNIFLKNAADGAQVRLSDVARVELGSDNYQFDSKFNGNPAGGVAIKLATGANALDTAAAVEKRLSELRVNYPSGLKDKLAYDTTPFIKLSIESVVHTLIEAVVLVFIVMFLFLQNWRATIIPTLAVPVVVLGTFAVINIFGFSINTLTMFAMVLAIGLLVDDAIVVVENVERVMQEEHLEPVPATEKSMGQISGALIGITSVLTAVFVPMAFFGGTTGVIYRQFSITLVTAMILSLIVALTFTPALCATLLKQHDPNKEQSNSIFARFFRGFNSGFEKLSEKYQGGVNRMTHHKLFSGVIYIVVIAALVGLYKMLPSSFLPEEDQGVVMTLVQLPPSASLERTDKVITTMTDYFLNKEKEHVESIFTVSGFSFTGVGQNAGLAFIKLKDWSERTTPESQIGAIIQRGMALNMIVKDASYIMPLQLPAMPELGVSSGFDIQLKDVSGQGHEKLIAARNAILGMASQDKRLAGVRPNGQEDTPQYKITVDQAQAGAMGVSISDINSTMSMAWGGSYINDFVDRGRVKKVYVQGEADTRMMPEDLNKWYVRNNKGEMVPFSAFAKGEWTYGSPRLERYNGVSSVNIQGSPAPGVSSGDAMLAMEEIIGKLPSMGLQGFDYEWTGLSLEERDSGNQTVPLLILSLLIVFLCLSALYESWAIPISVLLVVPLGIIGAFTMTWLGMVIKGDPNLSFNIYFQVAIVAVIGLSAKNAILIVEFAKELQEKGEELFEATLHAAKMRLRPIIMTTLAFGFGVLPLALASGAGAGSQHSVGYGVLGGVISSTLLGIFFIPVFFVWIRSIFKYKPKTLNTQEH